MHTVPDLRFSILTPSGWKKIDAQERIVFKGGTVLFKGIIYPVPFPFGSLVLILQDPDQQAVWIRSKYAEPQNISETPVPFHNRRRTDRVMSTGKHLDSLTIADSTPANRDCRCCPWRAQSNSQLHKHSHNRDSGLLSDQPACFGCVKVQSLHDYSN